jgi:hypothetical protein
MQHSCPHPPHHLSDCPYSQVDGKMLCQSGAIERYVAKMAGLTPKDAWEAAKVDETICFIQEISDLLSSTMSIKVRPPPT